MLWNQAQTPHRASGLTRSLRLGLIFGFPPHSAIRRMSGGRKALLCSAVPPTPHALGPVTGPIENRGGYCRGMSVYLWESKGCPLSYSEACKCSRGTSAGAGSQPRGTPSPCQLSEDWGNTGHGLGYVDHHVPSSQEKR